MSEDVEYFKFGGVRGIIGLAVTLLQLMFLAKLQLPSLQMGMQQIASFSAGDTSAIGGTVSGTMAIATLIIILPLAYLISGLMYWVGKYIVEYTEINVSGFWRVALSGVFGMLIVGLLLIFALNAMFAAMVSAGMINITTNLVGVAITAIPVALILEIGYAGVTWWVYKGMGWPTPA